MKNSILGFTLLLGSFFPLGGMILQKFTGGMYGQIFKQFPPIVYHLSNLSITFIPVSIFIFILFKKLEFSERIQPNYISNSLFGIGSFITIAYYALRIFTSTIQGGGASYGVTLLSGFFLIPAKIILFIAAVRFLIGVNPRPVNHPIKRTE